jgi:hypothetical protein
MALIKIVDNPNVKKAAPKKFIPVLLPADKSKPSTFGSDLNAIASSAASEVFADSGAPRQFQNGDKTFKETKNPKGQTLAE